MRKKLILGGLALAALAAASALAFSWAHRAWQHVPPFYREVIARRTVDQTQASQELEGQATALANDLRRQGRWHALFTADQINAWLAVELVERYPQLASSDVRQPRVAISPQGVILGFRWQREGRSAIISVHAELYVTETNSVACRLKKARAGALPIPLKRALDEITRACRRMDLPLRWMQWDGDPVAVVAIAPSERAGEKQVWLDRLELLDGAIYLDGHTERMRGQVAN